MLETDKMGGVIGRQNSKLYLKTRTVELNIKCPKCHNERLAVIEENILDDESLFNDLTYVCRNCFEIFVIEKVEVKTKTVVEVKTKTVTQKTKVNLIT